ncbi:MAG TPA: prolyl oligopeptidase family serine peptidase [Thermoanaerobaculia bacterium]|nr:prolyl oligopeptidase family serine peptidase [Thermoanaerobaculia bacterium]
MKTAPLLTFLVLFLGCATRPDPATDPYLWLEEIDSPRALAWVARQNERTRQAFTSMPGFAGMERQALAALNSESRVPRVTYRGRALYNLWRSPEHPRGIYRRTTLDELRKPAPRWTTVLDIDELSRREGRPWVFKGMQCLPPEHRRCLISLSPGGGDAVEVREFDAGTLRFVENGFFLPEAKSNVSWIDKNTLFVGTDFGPGSLTESGYPRVVKRWTRGTPLSAAETLYEAEPSAVSAHGYRIRTETGDIDLVSESRTFWTSRVLHLRGSELRPLALPETASIAGGYRSRLVVALQEPWGDFAEGSVVMVDPDTIRSELLMASTPSAIVQTQDVEVTDHGIFVPVLENVRGRLYRLRPGSAAEQIAFPDHGALSVMTADDHSGDALVLFETFTTPPALYYVAAGSTSPAMIMAQEPTFDGSRFEVTQQWAASKDGTRIPYFIVASSEMKRDGRNPAHIFTYGGFRSSLTPSYSGSYEQHYGAYGKLWLERGGVFVLANIRGGGEFGPAWHSSVLKENRHRVFEDFEAVAEDLVRSGITSPERLGIEGRSNGGLLTLATMVRRPDLYGAVISGVPLSDMRRYHELLAGASWIAEYGDPRVPAEWAFIREYSPYQNFSAAAEYPPLFVYTSTRDDRVHPGHARKSVARLQAQGHEVWYYENLEGGHGGSSTNEQLAYRIALSYAHLWRALGVTER